MIDRENLCKICPKKKKTGAGTAIVRGPRKEEEEEEEVKGK